jgi:hypothetical protein
MEQRAEQAVNLRSGLGYLTRKHRRNEIAGFVGDVTGGGPVVAGEVRDISPGGFRVRDLAAKYKSGKYSYSVVLSGQGHHFRMLATPCWEKVDPATNQTDTGFKILDCSWEWLEFTQNIFN